MNVCFDSSGEDGHYTWSGDVDQPRDGLGRGLLQGLANVGNAGSDLLVGVLAFGYNATSWAMNKTLGTENPYIHGPDWSNDRFYDERGMHGWNKLPADIAANAAFLAATFGGTAAGNTAVKEIPGKVWSWGKSVPGKIKNVWHGVKNWWKGAPKTTMKPPGWTSEWRWGPATGEQNASWRWYDPQGGEWRWHAPDKWHKTGHWDYNPWTEWNSPWQNIPANAVPPTAIKPTN